MAHSEERRAPRLSAQDDSIAPAHRRDATADLYFFPEAQVSEARVRQILRSGTDDERRWVVSHLLRYAQWDDIWSYVERDEVRELLPELDLPDRLAAAWGRLLEVAAPAG